MKKTFRQFQPGTAAFVVHHALYMDSRGKNPSEQYLTEKNPRKALKSAENIASAIESNASIGKHMASIGQLILVSLTKKPYEQMSGAEAQVAARHIIATSSTEEEVQNRIKAELGCPYVTTNVLRALSRMGNEARELCLAMGGVTLKTGELIQLTFESPDGSEMISV